MKKLVLSLLFLMVFAGAVIAAPHWYPTFYAKDTQASTTSTVLHDVSIYWQGVTVGDAIYLSNGTAAGATRGNVFYGFVAPTASGTYYQNFKKDLVLDSGIYVDLIKTTGTMGIGLTVN